MIAPPSATLALDRLAVRGAVSVVSTWWAGEGRRRRGGRGRRAGTPAQAHPRSHPPAPTSSHPLEIPRRQLMRSTRARACARAHVIRWAPPRLMDHLLTTYHISTPSYPLSMSCVDLITLHQFSFKSALCRLRLLKCAMRRRGPAAAAVAATPVLPTSPNPTSTTAPPTSTHQPTSTLPPHYPRYVQGQRLGSSPRR